LVDNEAGKAAQTQGRILIVEDEEALARHLGCHLGRAGYEVRMERSGKAGLLLIAEHWPDLVLLDLVLPDISGFEVCTELRRLYRPWHLPVLMLTALNSPKHRLLGFGHGADAYLTKPVSSGELLRTVETLLSHNVRGLSAGG